MPVLTPDQRILTKLQRTVLRLIAECEASLGPTELRLEGGTALAAFYLHHRLSEDLDLFGGAALNARDFVAHLRERMQADGLTVSPEGPASPGFAEIGVRGGARSDDSVRVQIARTSPFQLEAPTGTDMGVPVASFRDVAAGKLHAVCDRYEPRDHLDIHAILRRPDDSGGAPSDEEVRARVRKLVADVETCDPGLNETLIGQALARGLGRPIVSSFPLRLLTPVREEDIQATLRLAVDECGRLARERGAWSSGP